MKRIGVMFGMEDNFPWRLMEAITERSGGEYEGVPVQISAFRDEPQGEYALILDRISHEVPFYRTFLKCAAAAGTIIINNPFWWAADDKFFDNVVARAAGVAVPKTILLPHKNHPPNTQTTSFRNLDFVNWDEVFAHLGFPIFMKPADGGGWRDVYKVNTPEEFFDAYANTRDLCMMAQEAIEFDRYFRCYVIGRSRVHVMPYDPRMPFHERYVRNPPPLDPALDAKLRRDCVALCEALGYDLNTVELALRDGIPYAIDFMNPAPDADPGSVGEENFKWVIDNMTEFILERVKEKRRFEPTGTWPKLLPGKKSS